MSGRRSKKSKYYSRSYSKPLFDPQRLLYFSTTNQRIGKVIRPKTSAVNNTKVITKDDEKQILDDLNETKSFRLQRKGKTGFPICRLDKEDNMNSIDIQGLIVSQRFNFNFSFPMTTFLNNIEDSEGFVKNFQPYTPSLFSTIKQLHSFRLDINDKVAGDVLEFYMFILNGSDMEAFAHIPDIEALQVLLPFSFYHFQVPLASINKRYLSIATNQDYITHYVQGSYPEIQHHYIINLPKPDYTYEATETYYFPSGVVEFTQSQLTEECAARFSAYLEQQRESYELIRIAKRPGEHIDYQITESIDPDPLFDMNNDSQHFYICCSIFLTRTNALTTQIPIRHTLELEGIEINPYLIEQ